MNHGVIDRPVSMEVEHVLVPLSGGLHLHVRLVAHDVINGLELGRLDEVIEGFLKSGILEARKERSSIIDILHKGMDCVSISLNSGNNDGSIIILKLFRLRNGFSTSSNSLSVHVSAVFNLEGNIVDTVSVLLDIVMELSVSRVKRSSESVENLSVLNNMSAVISGSGLEALVSVEGESHSRSVEGCGLFGVGNVEGGMVESNELSNIRLKY